MSNFDRGNHLSRREFERVTGRGCPCHLPDMMSYDELMGAFKEAIRQRDVAERFARQMAEALRPFAMCAGALGRPASRIFLQLLVCPEGDDPPENYGPHFHRAADALAAYEKEACHG